MQVKQSYIVAPHEQHFQVVYHILKEHTSQVLDYKVRCLLLYFDICLPFKYLVSYFFPVTVTFLFFVVLHSIRLSFSVLQE